MYNIGDRVWYAGMESREASVVCPECFGKKYLTVILGDDSQVTIDCAGCASGYNPPKGYVTYYENTAFVEQVTITGFDVDADKIRYKFDIVRKCNDGFHRTLQSGADDYKVFGTKEEAEVKAKELAEEHNREKLERINCKEQHNHTWSWNVHYHRRQIREAKKSIEYHEGKLVVAREKSKEKEE